MTSPNIMTFKTDFKTSNEKSYDKKKDVILAKEVVKQMKNFKSKSKNNLT